MMGTGRVEDGDALPIHWEGAGFWLRAAREVAQPGKSRSPGSRVAREVAALRRSQGLGIGGLRELTRKTLW